MFLHGPSGPTSPGVRGSPGRPSENICGRGNFASSRTATLPCEPVSTQGPPLRSSSPLGPFAGSVVLLFGAFPKVWGRDRRGVGRARGTRRGTFGLPRARIDPRQVSGSPPLRGSICVSTASEGTGGRPSWASLGSRPKEEVPPGAGRGGVTFMAPPLLLRGWNTGLQERRGRPRQVLGALPIAPSGPRRSGSCRWRCSPHPLERDDRDSPRLLGRRAPELIALRRGVLRRAPTLFVERSGLRAVEPTAVRHGRPLHPDHGRRSRGRRERGGGPRP